jgi:hypothetical protein
MRYLPIDFDLTISCTGAEIYRVEMQYNEQNGANELLAYFAVAGKDTYVEVCFQHAEIFRVIDEMHAPLEEHSIETTGHVSGHFAYRVEGSTFWAAQRDLFEAIFPGIQHYRFVTGGYCLDVISKYEPSILWVSLPAGSSPRLR